MNFSPVPNTKKVNEADRWVGVIPPIGADKSGRFFVYVKDSQNQFQFYPRKRAIEISTPQVVEAGIVINEFMADNDSVFADPNGEYDDWIELFNPTANAITLTGKYLTDKEDNLSKWEFTEPNLVLNPNEFLIIWCDQDSGQIGIHTNFALSANGEFIALVDSDGVTVIDSISFGPQTTDISFGRYPDATNNWSFLFPTPGAPNSITSVEDEELIPSEFNIRAYPNPFNPSTNIRYSIPFASNVEIKIYDILGNEVAALINEEQPSGIFEVTWSGENSFGNRVSSGIYFARIKADQQVKNLKLMLLK